MLHGKAPRSHRKPARHKGFGLLALILGGLLMQIGAVNLMNHRGWGPFLLAADTSVASSASVSASVVPSGSVSVVPSGSVSVVPSGSVSVVPSGSVSVAPSASVSTTPSTSATPTPTSGTPAVPGRPTHVKAIAGNSSITVTWTAPTGTATITKYRATATPGPAACETDGATTCVLGGAAGTSYTVAVVAVSTAGESAASEPSNAAVPTSPEVSNVPPETDLPLDTSDGAITTAAPGQQITMIGDGYAAFSTVTFTVYSSPTPLGTVTADELGAFTQTVTVPDTLAEGIHSFVASGVDPDGRFLALRLDLTVAADSSGGTGGGTLPVTGNTLIWMIVLGFGATIFGVALRSVRR